jgi:hypothetical protein
MRPRFIMDCSARRRRSSVMIADVPFNDSVEEVVNSNHKVRFYRIYFVRNIESLNEVTSELTDRLTTVTGRETATR